MLEPFSGLGHSTVPEILVCACASVARANAPRKATADRIVIPFLLWLVGRIIPPRLAQIPTGLLEVREGKLRGLPWRRRRSGWRSGLRWSRLGSARFRWPGCAGG